jgi:dTDP-4-amino-4,6-dideoxygalactose transaminase
MIPNSISQVTVRLLIKQRFVKNARQRCEEWYRNYTGKKHILFTGSCRSALYLTYVASGRKGSVITSPLTCTSAIDPIIAAGLNIRFCDINTDTLLMDTALAANQIDSDISFIQTIHHGGIRMDIKDLHRLASEKNILLVEDCGQFFSVPESDAKPGFLGDVICFSMIKNGYGLGGGVLATDDEHLFNRAREIQGSWRKSNPLLLFYRIIRSLIEGRKHHLFFFSLYRWLLMVRPLRSGTLNPSVNIGKAMRQPSGLFLRTFLLQIARLPQLHKKRRQNGLTLLAELKHTPVSGLKSYHHSPECAFDKFFCLLPGAESERVAREMYQLGVEARHLESRYGSYRQPRLDELPEYSHQSGLYECTGYFEVHDKVLHLPLHEKMKPSDFRHITATLNTILP